MKTRNRTTVLRAFSMAVFLLALVGFGGTLAEAKTLKVPSKYATIQEAIDAASAGDTIKISSGTFTENIVIDKKLRIRGKSKTRLVAADDGEPTVTIAADDVELKRLDIRGGSFGVASDNASNLRLLSLKVRDATADGIFLRQSDNALVSKCRSFDNGGNGIFLEINSPGAVSVIQKCRAYRNASNGIKLEQGHDTRVESCRVYENANTGIRVFEMDDAHIKKNRVSENAIGLAVIGRSTDCVVEDNVFSKNQSLGFLVGESIGVARNNRSEKNKVGFFVEDGLFWVFERNKAQENTSYGFELRGSWSTTYIQNEATDNLGDGFYLLPGPGGLFADNLAEGNAGHGFLIRPHISEPVFNPHPLVGNRSISNSGDGFHAQAETFEISFTDNFADENAGFGFVDKGANLFEDNTCGGNNAAGPSNPVGLCD